MRCGDATVSGNAKRPTRLSECVNCRSANPARFRVLLIRFDRHRPRLRQKLDAAWIIIRQSAANYPSSVGPEGEWENLFHLLLTSEAAACGRSGDQQTAAPGESEPDPLPEFCPLEIHERRIMVESGRKSFSRSGSPGNGLSADTLITPEATLRRNQPQTGSRRLLSGPLIPNPQPGHKYQ